MEHESTRLTDEERRILAEIEDGLRRQRHNHLRLFRRSTPRLRRPDGRARAVRWAVVILGSAMLAGGLWVGAVWAAAAGYMTVVLALSRITADASVTGGLARIHRLIDLGDGAPRSTG